MTANTAKSRKAKGVRLETHVVKQIKEILEVVAKRMPKSGALKDFKSDIYTDIPFSIECKNQETWSIPEWWKQCTKDAETNKTTPLLVVSRNNMKEPLAVLRLEDLLKIMEQTKYKNYNKPKYTAWTCPECNLTIYNASDKDIENHRHIINYPGGKIK